MLEVISVLEKIQESYVHPQDDISDTLARLNTQLALQINKLPTSSCVYRLAMTTCQVLTREVGGLDPRDTEQAQFLRKLWRFIEAQY